MMSVVWKIIGNVRERMKYVYEILKSTVNWKGGTKNEIF